MVYRLDGSGRPDATGNPAVITEEGLPEPERIIVIRKDQLDAVDIASPPAFPEERIDFERVIPWKTALLRKAFERFRTHSLAADGGMWAEQIPPLLAAGFRALRLDMRGHGGSDPLPRPYTMRHLADDVAGALAALQIPRVHFIGLSIGGMLGQDFALAHPQRLISAMWCDTLPASPQGGRDVWDQRIATVREIGSEIEEMAGEAPPGYSSGGMVTKLAAARIAMGAGCRMLIAKGKTDGVELGPLAAIEASDRATLFLPRGEPRSARKAWIAGAVNPSGVVVVDDGAVRALRRGTSLLPAGVVAVEGSFERGDPIIIRTRAGAEAARGLSAYSSTDILRIAGHKSGEIAEILGYRGRDEIIHRDDLVVTEA